MNTNSLTSSETIFQVIKPTENKGLLVVCSTNDELNMYNFVYTNRAVNCWECYVQYIKDGKFSDKILDYPELCLIRDLVRIMGLKGTAISNLESYKDLFSIVTKDLVTLIDTLGRERNI